MLKKTTISDMTLELKTVESKIRELEIYRDSLLKILKNAENEESLFPFPIEANEYKGGSANIPTVTVEYLRAEPIGQNGQKSIRSTVVDAIIQMIQEKRRRVSPREILDYLAENKVSLGSGKKPSAVLGAILSQECGKKTARLKKAGYGLYDIKAA